MAFQILEFIRMVNKEKQAIEEDLEFFEYIKHHFNECMKKRDTQKNVMHKFLWLYYSDSANHSSTHDELKDSHSLKIDDWLNAIDEAASLNVDTCVISVTEPLCESRNAIKICQWAQDVHKMFIGLHLPYESFSQGELYELTQLKPELTCLLAPKASDEFKEKTIAAGYSLINSQCNPKKNHKKNPDKCAHPGDLLCIGSDGKLYPCGFVIGVKEYCMGDIRVESLMKIISKIL